MNKKRILRFLCNELFAIYVLTLLIILVVYCKNPQYGLYLIRWQLSTPTLAIFSATTVSYLSKSPLKWANKYEWAGATIANLIGGLGFYWFDKLVIFLK